MRKLAPPFRSFNVPELLLIAERIETPLAAIEAPSIAGKKLAVTAGLGARLFGTK